MGDNMSTLAPHEWDCVDTLGPTGLEGLRPTDVYQAVKQLPHTMRAVLVELWLNGRTADEATQVLGTTDQELRCTARAALHELRRQLVLRCSGSPAERQRES
jgi:DNA-directed RNA polymerase specialized sigma24 family protein